MTETITIPVNLDLVACAKFGLHGLIGTCDPEFYHESYYIIHLSPRAAYFSHWSENIDSVQPKVVKAMAATVKIPCLECSSNVAERCVDVVTLSLIEGRYLNMVELSGREKIVVTYPLENKRIKHAVPNFDNVGYRNVMADFSGFTCIV